MCACCRSPYSEGQIQTSAERTALVLICIAGMILGLLVGYGIVLMSNTGQSKAALPTSGNIPRGSELQGIKSSSLKSTGLEYFHGIFI